MRQAAPFQGAGNKRFDRASDHGGQAEQVTDVPVYNGTTGNETLTGGTGADTLNAFGGNDSLNAGSGNDVLFGGDGNDTLNGGNGRDTLYGGTGNDVATYASATGAVAVSLSTGLGSGNHATGDVLFEIEHLIGSNFADTLTGNAADNSLFGGGGNDAERLGFGLDTFSLEVLEDAAKAGLLQLKEF